MTVTHSGPFSSTRIDDFKIKVLLRATSILSPFEVIVLVVVQLTFLRFPKTSKIKMQFSLTLLQKH